MAAGGQEGEIMADHPNVVRADELAWAEQSHGERFAHRRKQLSAASGAEKLGCSLYEIPPERRAWPYHYHLANEEAIYILEGSGVLRIGESEVEVAGGDYVALPVGPATAHQIINRSNAPLRYLCFSTMVEPDVLVYPDSNKVGLFAGAAPGGPRDRRTMQKYLRSDAEVGYYDRED
jgi:uncharacterized cupin superfamily protein